MAEFLAITVHPAAQDADSLTVSDAMRQVLDVLEIMEKADAQNGDGGAHVVWRLKHASTNSPFTVQAEAFSSDPSISIAIRAMQAKRLFGSSMRSLLEEGRAPEWMDTHTLKTAKRILERNSNGVGRTDVALSDEEPPILIAPAIAHRAALVIDKAVIEEKLLTPSLARTEYGAAEGEVIGAVRYYNSPALLLKERLSGSKIYCVLSHETALHIGPERSWDDIWSGRRVLVSGAIHYNADGFIAKIDAEDVEIVRGDLVDLEEIRNLDITNGLRTIEFLNLLREENNG